MSSLRLVGAMLTGGDEWSLDEFGALFGRLRNEVEHEGGLLRYVGYQGVVGDHIEARFFGIEVEQIGRIPEGMVGWELRGNSWTVTEPDGTRSEGTLEWRWGEAGYSVVGEFSARLPGLAEAAEFRMSSNAYFERDEPLDDEVCLVDYDPSWPARYDEAAKWLREGLGSDVALRIEHYGSTSIPNMPAKPIVDLLVEIPAPEAGRRRGIPMFNKPGCEYWWHGDHVCFMIRERPMGKRTHHIHMAPAGHQLWEGLTFRDYLRAHPTDAARYADLKRELAERYRNDRERYTEAKGEFVRKILAKAGS